MGKQWIKKKITTEGKYATRKTQSRGEEGKKEGIKTVRSTKRMRRKENCNPKSSTSRAAFDFNMQNIPET